MYIYIYNTYTVYITCIYIYVYIYIHLSLSLSLRFVYCRNLSRVCPSPSSWINPNLRIPKPQFQSLESVKLIDKVKLLEGFHTGHPSRNGHPVGIR